MKNGIIARVKLFLVIVMAFSIAMLGAFAARAQLSDQKTFASSKQAVGAFIQAISTGDNSALLAILGAGSEAIVSSGDDVADKTARNKFLARYREKHSLVKSGLGEYTLNVGPDDWPLPIPLREKDGKWYFDGAAGKEEVLYRRIGHNELAAIDVCKGVVSAQQDYAAASHDGKPAGTYAERVMSDPGKQNGLYWEVKPDEPTSPAGPLLADATSEGYAITGQETPYHGYYYRMLKNPGGFAFVAYPAQYRSSGVMTFVVTQDGVVYQKDLGENTGAIIKGLNQYQIDGTWKKTA